MPKMTLLEITQNILSSMSSDEVNSISDTVESLQVAEEVRNTYYELYSNRNIAEFESLVTLESPGNQATPHLLTFPSNVRSVVWIRYKDWRNRGKFEEVNYLEPEDFIKHIVETEHGAFTPTKQVQLISSSPSTYLIQTNKRPHWYTIFDNDKTLVFDSYDAEFETYATGSSCVCWASIEETFELADEFVPKLEAHLFPHLVAEAKAACFINLKEVTNNKEEQRARRQLVRSQSKMTKTVQEDKRFGDRNDYSRKR